jgi:hypothetical protein
MTIYKYSTYPYFNFEKLKKECEKQGVEIPSLICEYSENVDDEGTPIIKFISFQFSSGVSEGKLKAVLDKLKIEAKDSDIKAEKEKEKKENLEIRLTSIEDRLDTLEAL